MSEKDYEEMSASEKKKEDWMNAKWRPMMGWMYMLVCTMDFVIFPVLWSLVQAYAKGAVNTQWQPLTLQGAGLFHMAMGAIIGVAAFGRTQEKLAGANNGGAVGTTYQPPAPTSGGFGNASTTTPPASGFGATAGGFGSTAPAASTGGFGSNSGFGAAATGPTNSGFGNSAPAAQVATGFGGKPAPIMPPDPIL